MCNTLSILYYLICNTCTEETNPLDGGLTTTDCIVDHFSDHIHSHTAFQIVEVLPRKTLQH